MLALKMQYFSLSFFVCFFNSNNIWLEVSMANDNVFLLRGRKEGIKEERKEGRKEGSKEGRKQTRLKDAVIMLFLFFLFV